MAGDLVEGYFGKIRRKVSNLGDNRLGRVGLIIGKANP
jgi:hypothetical protein